MEIACIFFDGVVPRSEADEYVEIVNAGSTLQRLAGWRLVDAADGRPTFEFPAIELSPGGRLRVYTNQIHSQWGGLSFGSGSAIWSNSDPDRAELHDAEGAVASTRTYPPGCDPNSS